MLISSYADEYTPSSPQSPRPMKSVEELVKLALENHSTSVDLNLLNYNMKDVEHRLRLQPVHATMDPKVPIEQAMAARQ